MSAAPSQKYLRFKRVTDILGAGMALVILSPLLILIVISQLVFNNGQVFFSQERIGRYGKTFRIYKFRTLSLNVESEQVQLMPDSRRLEMPTFGYWMRRTHLDELPQLWNVLRGDMSIIGYRPERKQFIDLIMAEDPRYEQLYKIRPGLSSKATILNGYTDTMEKMLIRLEMDLAYLEECSLRTDVVIIWMTLKSLFCTSLHVQ